MTIGASATIDFFGAEDQLTVATPGAVAAAAFSATGDVNDWTNDDDAPFAMFKLKVTAAGLSGAPAAGSTINLYCKHNDIESTEDTPDPSANYRARFLGSFVMNAADADQVHVIGPVRLPNYETSQVYEFFIENAMAVNIASDGWDLWVTPVTYGPHA